MRAEPLGREMNGETESSGKRSFGKKKKKRRMAETEVTESGRIKEDKIKP